MARVEDTGKECCRAPAWLLRPEGLWEAVGGSPAVGLSRNGGQGRGHRQGVLPCSAWVLRPEGLRGGRGRSSGDQPGYAQDVQEVQHVQDVQEVRRQDPARALRPGSLWEAVGGSPAVSLNWSGGRGRGYRQGAPPGSDLDDLPDSPPGEAKPPGGRLRLRRKRAGLDRPTRASLQEGPARMPGGLRPWPGYPERRRGPVRRRAAA